MKHKSIKSFRASLGSDPEMQLKRVSDGKIISSIPVLQHDKHDPIDIGAGAKMYADNVLVETSFPPSKTKKQMLKRIKDVFQRMQDRLGPEYRLEAKAAHIYDDDQLKDKAAIEVGCVESYNAYTCMANPIPQLNGGLRTGSFHLHIGNTNYKKDVDGKLLSFESRRDTIKLLDVFVGCSSVIFDKDETSLARRALYGRASEFRMTKYGIEYRCLSNYALRSPKLVDLVLDLVDYTLKFVADDSQYKILGLVDAQEVQDAINNCDKALAAKILDEAGLPADLRERVEADYGVLDLYSEWDIKVNKA